MSESSGFLRTRGLRLAALALVALLAVLLAFCPGTARADAASADDVRARIIELPVDPTSYKADDRAMVEALKADFDALGADDQAAIDGSTGHPATDQSLGRVLEAALWAVRSYGEVDNATTLPDGVYDATTTPRLDSQYSKGKSSSGRNRPWSVKSVEVRGGRATATVTVESSTYPSMWMGGVSYPNVAAAGANCEFEGVPIDLNSTFYFAGVSSSMPVPIAFSLTSSIDEEVAEPSEFTVTFVDGSGVVVSAQKVKAGGTAAAPGDPERAGLVFSGWDVDVPVANVQRDMTVNATWEPEGTVMHTVTFTDGQGGVLKVQKVKHGEGAAAPAVPVREGYDFTGWDPAGFADVAADLTVNATWVNAEVANVRALIGRLPARDADLAQIADVFEQVGNQDVAAAGEAYNALSDGLKGELASDERLRLVRALIAVLPYDAYDVTADMAGPIQVADAAFGSLGAEEQAVIADKDNGERLASSLTYGRYLENAVWALDSLKSVYNVTTLKNGTYTVRKGGAYVDGFDAAFSIGLSSSRREMSFYVTSITVKGGRATATLEHSSNSSQTLRLGGEQYTNLQADPSGRSYYEVPINLNSTFHFSYKGKAAEGKNADETPAMSYELTVKADEGALKPDTGENNTNDGSQQAANPNEQGGGAASGSGSGSNGGTAGRTSGGQGGAAGNLASLVTGNKNAGNANGTAASGKTGSNSATGNAQTAGAGGKDANGRNTTSSAGKRTAGDTQTVLSSESTAAGSSMAPREVLPAIVGGVVLAAAIGGLAFALFFIRREDRLPQLGLWR